MQPQFIVSHTTHAGVPHTQGPPRTHRAQALCLRAHAARARLKLFCLPRVLLLAFAIISRHEKAVDLVQRRGEHEHLDDGSMQLGKIGARQAKPDAGANSCLRANRLHAGLHALGAPCLATLRACPACHPSTPG